jgi:hypothetical protein
MLVVESELNALPPRIPGALGNPGRRGDNVFSELRAIERRLPRREGFSQFGRVTRALRANFSHFIRQQPSS